MERMPTTPRAKMTTTMQWMSSRHRRKLNLTCTDGYHPCAAFPSKARNRRWKWPSLSLFQRLWFRQHLWLKPHPQPGLEQDLGSAPWKDAGSPGNTGCPRIGRLGPAIPPTCGFCLLNYWAFVFSLCISLVSDSIFRFVEDHFDLTNFRNEGIIPLILVSKRVQIFWCRKETKSTFSVIGLEPQYSST